MNLEPKPATSPKTPPPAKSKPTFQLETYAALLLDPSFEQLYFDHYSEMVPDKHQRPLRPDHGRYSRLSAAGMLKIVTARAGTELVGYSFYLVTSTLHHGPEWIVALNDTWFMSKTHRRGLAALRMLKACFELMRANGASVVYHGSLTWKPIDKLLRAAGMCQVQTTWQMLTPKQEPAPDAGEHPRPAVPRD